jgi:DTW domain-containing protein YfiP
MHHRQSSSKRQPGNDNVRLNTNNALGENHSVNRRRQCPTCLRAQTACICHWVTPTANQVEVVVLQHPKEVDHAKGSARLLHLSLQHSQLAVGDVFDDGVLKALLTGPPHAVRHTLLLYPALPQDEASGLAVAPALPANALLDPSALRLVVLDGTWRKSRKMLFQNPLLQQLPRLALAELAPSRYLIRKARRPEQRSTLEATCAALSQLEGDLPKYEPLLVAFDGFVAQQAANRHR